MTQEDIGRLQAIEQNLQTMLLHKQQAQANLMEIDAALTELGKAKTAYKIIGNVMVSAGPEELKKELEQKKDMVQLRVSTFEKQEKKLRDQAKELQEKVMKELKT